MLIGDYCNKIEIEIEYKTGDQTKEATTMYKAKNGFTLQDDSAPGGWTIKTAQDIETALYSFPYFQTVASGVLWDAIAQAVNDRRDYADIKEFAQYLADCYV